MARERTGEPFVVFESLLFAGSPNLAPYGIRHLRIIDDHELWKTNPDRNSEPSVADIKSSVAGRSDHLIVLDTEGWDMTGSESTIQISRAKYIAMLEHFRAAAPGTKFGLYSVLPDREYWPALSPRLSDAYKNWQRLNDLARPIVSHVDILFPSLYTFYPDQAGWVRYATENLREARRISNGKPVYCFLWPQFHDDFRLVDGDYWRKELEVCGALADGVVIWGGYRMVGDRFEPLPWDPSAAWWTATLDWLRAGGRQH